MPGANAWTDHARAYGKLAFRHQAVKHLFRECVKGGRHANEIESPWYMLKRTRKSTYPCIGPNDLDRYVQDFVRRHNIRSLALATIDQMEAVGARMSGKQLRYKDLIAASDLGSDARSWGGGCTLSTRLGTFQLFLLRSSR